MPENVRDVMAGLPVLELCERLDAIATRIVRENPESDDSFLIHEAVLRLTEAAATADNTDSVKVPESSDGYVTIAGIRVYGPAYDTAPVPVNCPGHGDDEDCDDNAANPCKACFLFDPTVGRSRWPETEAELPPAIVKAVDEAIDEHLAERVAEANAALRKLLADWFDGELAKISEHGTSRDWPALIEDAKARHEVFGIPWRNEFVPDYVREVLAIPED